MLSKVLKAFPYAADHHTVETLAEGAVVEIDDEVFDGLEAEGFITEAEVEADNQVEIPEDFATIAWPKLQAIGRRLGLPARAGKVDTLAAIQTELTRRGGA